MIYSKTCEYAIRALSYLAAKPDQKLTMIPEIGNKTQVPEAYLAKIFQALVKHEILISRRGPSGGFSLKKKPSELTLLEIVKAVDDIERLNACVMGLEDCSIVNACPMHEVWADTKQKVIERLEACSLSELIDTTADRTYLPVRRSRLHLNV